MKIGPAISIASNSPVVVVLADACAFASISVIFAESFVVNPNALRVLPKPLDTVARSVPVPTASAIAGSSKSMASSAVYPWRAKLSIASAASFTLRVEFDAAFSIASLIFLACSSVAPIVALTSCMVLSTSPAVLSAFVPSATSGVVMVAVIFAPADAILSPIDVRLEPAF